MDAVLWVLVGVAVPLALISALRIWMQVRTRQRAGEAVPAAVPPLPTHGPALVYFNSPTCGPCRVMRPTIQALAEAGRPVAQVDVSRDLDVALRWKVMATPTTVAVRDGRIEAVLLGVVAQDQLEKYLDNRGAHVGA